MCQDINLIIKLTDRDVQSKKASENSCILFLSDWSNEWQTNFHILLLDINSPISLLGPTDWRWNAKNNGQMIFYRISCCTGENVLFQVNSLAVLQICFQWNGGLCTHFMSDCWRRRRVQRRTSNRVLGFQFFLCVLFYFTRR